MVIDTETNVTLVRANVFQNLHPKPAEVQMKPISLQTATGERAKVHYCVLLSIQIRSKIFHNKGYVAGIMDDCIIGLNVLRQFGLSIDIGRNLLRTGDEDIPLLTSQQLHNFHACRVLALEDTQVPPHSEFSSKDSWRLKRSLEGQTREDHLQQVWEETKKELQPGQQRELATLLATYGNIFAKSSEDYGRTDLSKHRINIVVLVRKKDGSTIFCIDYRKLNDITKNNSYPFPCIDTTLDTLAGSQWFSTLDLKMDTGK
ncbi:K02A2.6-like [Cordylochernes scorpioides]|uniref:K02A2.6-like n=1 Tax=Cordylochernes scorpioides TaxID=51811 RepID=A0ABY6L7Z6_9ARAC|nr:K02A2.6-like [Cordylochernes scorpioides]